MQLTWRVTLVVLALIGAATFLLFEHDFDPQTVAGLFSAIAGAVLVGHFAGTSGSSSSSGGGA